MKNIFSKNKKSAPRKPHSSLADRLSTDPYLDWMIIVALSALLIALFMVFGMLTYMSISDRLASQKGTAPTEISAVFDEDVLQRIIERLDDRATSRSSVLRGTVSIPSDPSI